MYIFVIIRFILRFMGAECVFQRRTLPVFSKVSVSGVQNGEKCPSVVDTLEKTGNVRL